MRNCILTLGLALVAPGFVAAQESASGLAQIVVLASTNFSKSSDLDFGTHYATEGVITCSQCTPARFDGLGQAGRLVDISIGVPSVLTRVGNTASIPITFGSESASFQSDGGTLVRFGPTAGLVGAMLTGSGGFAVWLGGPTHPASADQDVSVNLAGAGGGTYRGTIVVSVIQH